MSLRRFAQTNHASVSSDPSSPMARKTANAGVGPSTPGTPSPLSPYNGARTPVAQSPGSPLAGKGTSQDYSKSSLPKKMLPVTPRRVQISHAAPSPANSPSLSASMPFDWVAARSRRAPPYGSPIASVAQRKKRQSLAGGGGGTPAGKRFVRKKGLMERLSDIPAWIAFEISIFPANVPLPEPRTSAILLGGALHAAHLSLRIAQGRKAAPVTDTWEQWRTEDEPWFDWTMPLTFLLVLIASLNALYVVTRIRVYHLHQQPDPVASPNAKFVPVSLDRSPPPLPALSTRIRQACWAAFVQSWRFLLNLSPSTSAQSSSQKGPRVVQQVDMWAPGELEMGVLAIYSPAHALLWMCTTGSNWVIMGVVMGLVGMQMRVLVKMYDSLVRDKAIIAAEVMHEYDQKFVYPRINPIRKDVAVMTHESEMVNVWE